MIVSLKLFVAKSQLYSTNFGGDFGLLELKGLNLKKLGLSFFIRSEMIHSLQKKELCFYIQKN